MELEKAFDILKYFKRIEIMYGRFAITTDELRKIQQAIETVLQAFENSKEECRQYREFIIATGGKDIDDITATQYVSIQREGYLRGREEEREKAKQFIEENSIPKKKIEDKIKELKDKIKQNEKELRKKPEPVGSGFGSFDEYFKWRYKVIHENELLKEEIKDIQQLLEEK